MDPNFLRQVVGGVWAPAFGAPVVVVPSPMSEYKADTSYKLAM